MRKIDVHADDYGLTLNTSRDIMYGILQEKLNSISVMPNMSCFEEAKEYYYQAISSNKEPFISVHLNFMEGYCVADKSKLSYLVDTEGLFRISWGSLVKYNYNFVIRKRVKEQLKLEIKAQLERVIEAYHLLENGKQLRVDSHQHTHMIPVVMEALLEVIRENKIPTEYVRISKEPWMVYLKRIEFFFTYRIINVIKVIVLNFYAKRDEKLITGHGLPTMLLSGVFLSGKMDGIRVSSLLPALKKYAERKDVQLEVLFHPGSVLEDELGKEFNHAESKEFYLSPNRKIEFNAMINMVQK